MSDKRRRLALLSGLGTALVLGVANLFVDCVALVPEALEEVATSDEPRTPPKPDPGIRPAVVPEKKQRTRPEGVVFLPTLNRTAWRVHPTYLRGVGDTLAAFSTLFLEMEAALPEVAAALSEELGFPAPYTQAGDFEPDVAALRQAAPRLGVEVVVWSELAPPAEITLRALRVDTDVAHPWDGFAVSLEGEPDLALYDAPRALLSAMLSEGLVESDLSEFEDVSDRARLEREVDAAVAEMWSGSVAAVRRAELALADIVASEPGLAGAWVQLAFARTLRSQLFRPECCTHAPLADGPNPARHIARVLPWLEPDEAALLEVAELPSLEHLWSGEHLEKLLGELPASSPARALLAKYFWGKSRDLFGLGAVDARGLLAQSLTAISSEPTWAGVHSRAEALAGQQDRSELLSDTYLLDQLWRKAHADSRWNEEGVLRAAHASSHASAVIESLRARCAELDRSARDRCYAPIEELLRGYLGADETPDLADTSAWIRAQPALQSALMLGPLAGQAPELRSIPNSEREPLFASALLLLPRLVVAANEVLEVSDGEQPVYGAHARLVSSPVRREILAGVNTLFGWAYYPAIVGKRRGQPDESAPYLEALRPFARTFLTAKWLQTIHLEAANRKEAAAAAYERLVALDPYDLRWHHDWIQYVEIKEKLRWGNSSVAESAAWLRTLVPRPPAMTELIARAYWKSGDRAASLEVTGEMIAHHAHPSVALYRDKILRAEGASRPERLHALRALLRSEPRYLELRKRVINLDLALDQLDDADATLQPLRAERYEASYTCAIRVEIAVRRGDRAAPATIYEECAQEAPDSFSRARKWVKVAAIHRSNDAYAESLAALKKAYDEIGEASDVLLEIARIYELMEDYESAEKWYGRVLKTYPENKSARYALASLYQRQGRAEDALGELEGFANRSYNNYAFFEHLRRAFTRAGRIDELLALCERTPGAATLYTQAMIHWKNRGDHDAALAALARFREKYPQEDPHRTEAEILVEAGRAREAVALTAAALKAEPNSRETLLTHISALVAAGDVAAARRAFDGGGVLVERRSGAEVRARVLVAEGRPREALAALAAAHESLPLSGVRDLRYWEDQANLLVAETPLAVEHARQGPLRALYAELRRTAHRVPHDPELWQALARVAEKLGERDVAEVASSNAEIWNPRNPPARETVRNEQPAGEAPAGG